MKTLFSSIFAIVVVLLGLGLTLLFSQPWLLLGALSFTKPVKVAAPGQDRSYYYRFKAGYAYMGEPLHFDIVVGCNVRITTYKDNDRTVEIGIAPMVFGLKMTDGRGVVIRPPEACRGETTDNGKVPAALLPLVVTYENADKPWIGLAYASEDAYESPISELKFFGATISRATREEWQEWRRTEAPKSFITYELLGINAKNIWEHPHWKPGYRAMGSICRAFSWVKLPEVAREAIRPYWPSSKPNYWYGNQDAEAAFRAAAGFATFVYQNPSRPGVLFEGHRLSSYFELPKFLSKDSAVGTLYPAKSDLSFNRLDDSGELPAEIRAKARKSYSEANLDPQLKGFAYCDIVWNIDDIPSTLTAPQNLANRINGELINEELERHGNNFSHAFGRDEYVIFDRSYALVSIFGGL
ncbi:hypothetical protein ACQR1Y_20910 [Bradyrhizobium sp. HKCCYLRH3099]|uniref:hypothetical protein n=1 Tax=unclassified Bradyrhizobium TaxID=2631580 RepID=UPI003EBF56FE